MFRNEPGASFRVAETTRPDPRHRGVCFVARRYFLAPGGDAVETELPRDRGETIAAGQHERPQPIGHIADRYWWMFRDRVYSCPDELTRAAVQRLIDRDTEAARKRLAAATNPLSSSSRGRHATA